MCLVIFGPIMKSTSLSSATLSLLIVVTDVCPQAKLQDLQLEANHLEEERLLVEEDNIK